MNKPLIIAHRGIYTDPSEQNTLVAFKRAVSNQVDGIEMDLRMTKDNIIVLWHDRRVQNGDLRYHWIDKLTYDELMHIQPLPRFEDIIKELQEDLATQANLLDLDLKQSNMAPHIARILAHYDLTRISVCSPNMWTLRKFEQAIPHTMLGLTYYPEDKWDLWENKAFRYITHLARIPLKPFLFRLIRRKTSRGDIEIANIQHKMVTKKVVDFLHEYNIHIFSWGTDNEKRLKQLIEWGVDGIKISDPSLITILRNTAVPSYAHTTHTSAPTAYPPHALAD
jgi:glycerophosphoryl diester phosphodiesterase